MAAYKTLTVTLFLSAEMNYVPTRKEMDEDLTISMPRRFLMRNWHREREDHRERVGRKGGNIDVIYVQPRKGRPEQVIQLRKVWKKLEHGETLTTIARKYGICSKTLSEALRRVDKDTYEEIRINRKRQQTILPVIGEIWKRLEQGEALNAIANQYKTSYSVISRTLKQIDGERYENIMKSRRTWKLNLPIGRLWKKLQHGRTVADIARENDVNSNTLAHMLQRIYGNRYERIIASRRRGNAILTVIDEIWKRLEHGYTLRTLAARYVIGRTTLTRILRRDDQRKYAKLVSVRGKRKLSFIASILPISKIWKKLEHGRTVIATAKEYKICAATLSQILRSNDQGRYERTVGIRKGKRNRGRYGSPEARKQGSDSAIELRVKRILKKNKVRFCYQTNLKLNGHCYQPDFMFENHTILEVAGLTITQYWTHYKRKIGDYIEAGYRVILVTPNYVCKVARNYLPQSSMVTAIEEKDFVMNITQILKTTNTATPTHPQKRCRIKRCCETTKRKPIM